MCMFCLNKSRLERPCDELTLKMAFHFSNWSNNMHPPLECLASLIPYILCLITRLLNFLTYNNSGVALTPLLLCSYFSKASPNCAIDL